MDSASYKVILAPSAIRDLAEIVRFIALDDRVAAERFGNALIDQTKKLANFPELGRPVLDAEDLGAREIVFRAYRVIYRVDKARKLVEVARFWHAARGRPQLGEYE